MKAKVGDELIIDSPEPTHPGRIGTIIALTNHDGSPPYVVRSLVGYESLVFPARMCGSNNISGTGQGLAQMPRHSRGEARRSVALAPDAWGR